MKRAILVIFVSAMFVDCANLLGVRNAQGALGRWQYQDAWHTIKVQIPKGWSVLPKKEMDSLHRLVLDRMAGEDYELRKEIAANDEKSLLWTYRETPAEGPQLLRACPKTTSLPFERGSPSMQESI